ncbi:VOC family protein [Brevibacillus thermoruber]|jgi:Glyoxalase-like domain|uniref:VOC family protein n=1 Tax=Brevibacillus thermoruber TaxID=33942 RepID=UPI004042CFD7
MELAFDHLVHFLRRPPVEAAERLQKEGFHALAGGRHEAWGTCNSLSYFGLAYVEFLAVEYPEVAERSDNPLVRQLVQDAAVGEGMGQIALRTRDIERWAEHFHERGMKVTGPLPGSRKREDGTVIRWQMLFAETPEERGRVPFLIQWEQSDDERRDDLTRRGVIAPHPNGTHALKCVCLAAEDADEAAERWRRWFGLEAADAFVDEGLNARCRTLAFSGGAVVLCQPLGEGLARDALLARGERPFFVRFAGGSGEIRHELYGGWYAW